LAANPEAIDEAAAVLRRGGLVAFPTETVYGLGADAENETALRALFAAKGRPVDHPVIMHLANATMIDAFVAEVPPSARKLAAAFWPGPMTLVLPRARRVNDLVTGGLHTVGLRVPSHPVAQALLTKFGGPIAAPSANRFGCVSCTRAEHVAEELGNRVELILDGGECQVGLESTILDVTSDKPAILRPGAVTADQIAVVLNAPVAPPQADSPRVSGSLPSHYAPRAIVELVDTNAIEARATKLAAVGKKVAVLGRNLPAIQADRIVRLEFPANDAELAHSLYALLRQVDALGCDVALVVCPPGTGLAAAINDRLRRAAGPRTTAP
jgi:L-threonylcarbamoyladenylate synthase